METEDWRLETKEVMKRKLVLIHALLFILLTASTNAQQTAPASDPSLLTLDSIFSFRTRSLGPVQWQQNGSGYLALEPSANNKDVLEIVRYDALSGERTIKVPAEKLVPSGATAPISIEDFVFTPDEQRLLISRIRRAFGAATRAATTGSSTWLTGACVNSAAPTLNHQR